jgi:hypothetical protein
MGGKRCQNIEKRRLSIDPYETGKMLEEEEGRGRGGGGGERTLP